MRFSLLCLFIFFIRTSVVAFLPTDISLFPTSNQLAGSSSGEFRHYLFTGRQQQKTVTRGNLGLSFPIIGLSGSDSFFSSAGVAANVHLAMFPRNMKFAVDNFYATLAMYLEALPRGRFSFRLYPVYHVSAHLGDGHADDSALVNAYAVSSEMVKIESICSPLPTLPTLSTALGYGYYYHVCAQKDLTDLFDASIRYFYKPYPRWKISLILTGQMVCRKTWSPGGEAEAGIYFTTEQRRGIGIMARYFNRTNSGYFFEKRDRGIGGLIEFLP